MTTQSAAQSAGQDPIKVDSKHYTVELENEKVRVLRIRYGPVRSRSCTAIRRL
jgi:hypothetical protein